MDSYCGVCVCFTVKWVCLGLVWIVCTSMFKFSEKDGEFVHILAKTI